jgi:hypothetical protein
MDDVPGAYEFTVYLPCLAAPVDRHHATHRCSSADHPGEGLHWCANCAPDGTREQRREHGPAMRVWAREPRRAEC